MVAYDMLTIGSNIVPSNIAKAYMKRNSKFKKNNDVQLDYVLIVFYLSIIFLFVSIYVGLLEAHVGAIFMLVACFVMTIYNYISTVILIE